MASAKEHPRITLAHFGTSAVHGVALALALGMNGCLSGETRSAEFEVTTPPRSDGSEPDAGNPAKPTEAGVAVARGSAPPHGGTDARAPAPSGGVDAASDESAPLDVTKSPLDVKGEPAGDAPSDGGATAPEEAPDARAEAEPSDGGAPTTPDASLGGQPPEGDDAGGDTAPAIHDEDILALSGLRMWLDASQLSPGPVSAWVDRSLWGNHAEQSNEYFKPIAELQEGTASVRFDGIDDHLVVTHHQGLDALDLDVCILAVYQHETDPTTGDGIGVVYYKGIEGSPSTGLGLEANFITTEGMQSRLAFSVQELEGVLLSGSTGMNDGVTRLVSGYRYDATVAELRINGIVDHVAEVPFAYMDTTRNGFIGAQVTSGGLVWQPLDGNISELLIIMPVTRDELQMVERYLLEKHALRSSSDGVD